MCHECILLCRTLFISSHLGHLYTYLSISRYYTSYHASNFNMLGVAVMLQSKSSSKFCKIYFITVLMVILDLDCMQQGFPLIIYILFLFVVFQIWNNYCTFFFLFSQQLCLISDHVGFLMRSFVKMMCHFQPNVIF